MNFHSQSNFTRRGLNAEDRGRLKAEPVGTTNTADEASGDVKPASRPAKYLFNALVAGLWLAGVAGATLVNHAQVQEGWIVRYGVHISFAQTNGFTSFTGDSEPVAVALDNAGNVYVTGSSYGTGTSFDYATVKYDANGNELWAVRYNGPANLDDVAKAMVVDSAGNVYVTGYSNTSGASHDYATVKYDASGNQIWVAIYDGPASGEDIPAGLAVDAAGNVYVTGDSYGGSSSVDYATIKYDATGNQAWVARYNGPSNGFDHATSVAVDQSGSVCVTGHSIGGPSSYDYATLKYDANGNQQWIARYDGPASRSDQPTGLVVDNTGNIYVTGYSPGIGTGADYATIKYDPNGNELWLSRYDGPPGFDDFPSALALDSAGNVIVTGSSTDVSTSQDFATVKYDGNSGNQLWVARYNAPANGSDGGTGLAIDSRDNIYVTGYSSGGSTLLDYTTVKYDANGSQAWTARHGGPGDGNDIPAALTVDSAGNTYVTGRLTDRGQSAAMDWDLIDYGTIKYVQTVSNNEATVAAGETANLTSSPDASVTGAVSVAVQNSGDPAPMTVSVESYSGNPTGSTVFDAGGGFTDLKILGADSGDYATAYFYYPATVPPSAESAVELFFFDGSAWLQVRSSGNLLPLKDTNDNLDGTISGGRFTVFLDASSIPSIDGLSGTVFAMVRADAIRQFNGFKAPISGADGTGGSFASPVRTFKFASTIPVKFELTQGGTAVSTGVHTLQAVKYSSATTPGIAIDATPRDAATTGDQFRFQDGQWGFNLDTKSSGMSPGIWELIAKLSDGTRHTVWIQLK